MKKNNCALRIIDKQALKDIVGGATYIPVISNVLDAVPLAVTFGHWTPFGSNDKGKKT